VELDFIAEKARRRRPTVKFESLDACWREDLRRADALRKLPGSFYPHMRKQCEPLELATVLTDAAEHQVIERCAASAAYMRDRRLALLGSILKLLDAQPQPKMAFVSISHIGWYFTPRYNWRIFSLVPNHLFDLFEDGPSDQPGFFIGSIRGQYQPRANNIQLTLIGLCAGDKIRAFENMADDLHPANLHYDVGVWNATNLLRQITVIMPPGIEEMSEAVNAPNRRMREPYHSVYLMWLVEQSLSTLVITDNISVSQEGELVAES
jgi:hypothetical protein